MLLNVSIFMWYGAVCPWNMFLENNVVPLGRLVALGILILLFRRLPWVYAIHKKIPQIEQYRQAIFVGFFGPIGVSAVFYLYITREFVATLKGEDGEIRSDVANLSEAVLVIVWFLCICSVVVHGLSIPLGKLGWNIPRTLTRGKSDDPDSIAPFSIGSRTNTLGLHLPTFSSASRRNSGAPRADPARPMWRIGGTVIRGERGREPGQEHELRQRGQQQDEQQQVGTDEQSGGVGCSRSGSDGVMQEGGRGEGASLPALGPASRTIRFPDEAHDGGRGGLE